MDLEFMTRREWAIPMMAFDIIIGAILGWACARIKKKIDLKKGRDGLYYMKKHIEKLKKQGFGDT